ncbi:MAG: DUF2608 domain-containing protein [Bdellovibrionales bacterium]|nr:DUF2608 domain-containing protein [Bdellovibrionales bacterium]
MKFFLLTLLASLQLNAQIIETPSLGDCLKQASASSAQYKSEEVAFVFDIDNTTLMLLNDLGSVHWFRWQYELIKSGATKNRVANNISELLEAQGWIYNLSTSRTPETNTATWLASLQTAGHPVLFHTSRSPSARNSTERDLEQNHLIPLVRGVGAHEGRPGTFIFQELSKQRPVSFQNSVYMTDGQDKGVWLEKLFNKIGVRYKHIVFVDDELKNLQNVENAFKNKIPQTLCRYSRLDSRVQAFNNSNKLPEIELWSKLSRIIQKLHHIQ